MSLPFDPFRPLRAWLPAACLAWAAAPALAAAPNSLNRVVLDGCSAVVTAPGIVASGLCEANGNAGNRTAGDTVNGNLIPGLYTTNSAMIPFEGMIKDWSIDDPHRFAAKFSIVGQQGVFVDKIVISIKGIEVGGRGHKTLGTQERVLLEFDPLQGRVVDRMGGLFVKRAVDFAEIY